MLRIFRHYIPLPTIVVSTVEIIFIFLTFYLSLSRDPAMTSASNQSIYYSLGFAILIFIVMVALGLYNRSIFGKHREMLIRIVLSFCFVLPVFLIAMESIGRYLPKIAVPAPETYLPGMLLGLISVAGTRFLILPMADVRALKKRVLVIGVGDLARRIERLLSSNPNQGFLVVDFVRLSTETPCSVLSYLDEKKLPNGHTLTHIAEEKLVDEIVIATRDRRGLPIDALLDCKLKGITITEYLTFWERENGQIDLEALQPSWLFFSDGFRMNWFPNLIKRLFDVVVSLVFLTLTLPVIGLTAIALRLEGAGPIFYVQERVGLNGRRFPLMKFRSMSANAETDGVPRWATANDQRITHVGALIRKTRIDEIPQVINVLRGDMSFIGPRPERPFFVETLMKEIPYYNERHRVKPGISGWAQINYPYGASVEDARQKLTYDLYYVKNRSLFLDFVILLQTARVILWPEGVR
jgi:sugar transferase (PEP-CTERM system associated)